MNAKIVALFFILLAFQGNSQILNSPESILFDPVSQLYLVSNAGSGTSGGSLVYFDPLTNNLTSFVSTGVSSPKGMAIINNMVYVTDVTSVRGFSLESHENLFNLDIPGSSFLNDMTSDGTLLYVSDNAVNKIFVIDIQQASSTILCEDPDLQSPNGILYDGQENRLLICSFRSNSPIQEFNLASSILNTLTTSTLSQLDGLAMDVNRNVYVSSWASNAVFRFDPDFSSDPVEVSNGHFGPADIFINSETNELLVPNFSNNTINIIDLGPMNIEDMMNPFRLVVFPNPSYSQININFQIEDPCQVQINVINKTGELVAKICDKNFSRGKHQLNYDLESKKIDKGIYFLKFTIDDHFYIKRMVFL